MMSTSVSASTVGPNQQRAAKVTRFIVGTGAVVGSGLLVWGLAIATGV